MKKGKKDAQLRTFFSKNDYISQDLTVEKVKWLTAAYDRMYDISLYEHHWDYKESTGRWTPNMFFWTDADIDRMRSFFKEWSTEKDARDWTAVTRFQDMVKQKRLDERHAKETNPIDALMETVKEIPDEFKNWVSDKAMSFSRYLIYATRSKNEALVHCTHCNGVTLVDRTKIRLRNNEKGICPLCGSPVTIKARGRMPARICDRRIVSFIDPREEGFLWRYFTAYREVKPDGKTNDGLFEIVRTFYKFAPNGTPCTSSYEYREYKQTGIVRWCTDEGYRESSYCTLYPGNLPEAWKDTPMKYSALEILAENRPSEQIHYAKAINRYREFPQLEWFVTTLNSVFNNVKYPLTQAAKDGWLPRFILKENRFGAPYIVYIYILIVAVLPIMFDMSIVTITNIFQVITFFVNVTVVYAISRLPKRYPEAWGKNKFHLSDRGLYAFCTISIIIYTVIFVKGIFSIPPIYAVVAVAVMIVLIILGIYLTQKGGIHIETSIWQPAEEDK